MNHNPENFQNSFAEDDSDMSNRMADLLADRSLGELEPSDSDELNQLLAEAESGDHEAFDRIAASLELGLIEHSMEPLPEELRQKALTTAMREMVSQRQPLVEKTSPPKIVVKSTSQTAGHWFLRLAPTLAAAAILLVAFSMYPREIQSTISSRQALLDTAKDVVVIPWIAMADPAATGASGDVAWSNSRQVGFMRFNGLPKNNPTQEQYQLWIFDPSQDARYPVDGGVFNIDKATGEAIIPISARLHLSGPTLFAITIEKPGGVVVSDRKRLPLLAKTTH